jgi:hypothetical protein
MYRQYEDPVELQKRLDERKEDLRKAYATGADVYEIMDIELEIEELKDRINFAWQDDEYDSEY